MKQILCLVVASVSIVNAQQVVKVGTAADYPPWSFKEGDNVVGYDIDVINEICALQSLNCTIAFQPWESLIPSLRFKKFDVLIDGISHTASREQKLLFSDPYCTEHSSFVVKSGTPAADVCQADCVDLISGTRKETVESDALATFTKKLEALTIGVQEKTSQSASLRDLFPNQKTVSFKDNETAIAALIAGKVDAVYTGTLIAKAQIEKNGSAGLIQLKTEFEGGELGKGMAIGFRKDDTSLRDVFNEGLKKLQANGKLKVLSEKWFNTDITPK